jgi:hypothetical protein
MKKFTFCFILLCATLEFLSAQVNFTARNQVTPYTLRFRAGVNLGYYPLWGNQQLADIAAGNPVTNQIGVGARAMRQGLYEEVLENFGYNLVEGDFNHYDGLNLSNGEAVAILGGPAPWHKDNTFYCPGESSNLFANLYTPTWDGGLNGTPYNDNNYWAAYLYKVVTQYKDDVRFWEIWNEPGLDFGACGWRAPGDPICNWWDRDPLPCEYILKAPVEHYVRTLRIAWDVIKTVDPDSYVCLGSVGYQAMLDAVLRNTDNPNGGGVTAEYPYGGGAYFDVVTMHTYPHFDGSTVNFNQNVFARHSDRAADGVFLFRDTYQAILNNYGYNGVTFPKKEWIITEANAPRNSYPAGQYFAGEVAQRNYIQKAFIVAKLERIGSFHVYQLFDRQTSQAANYEFDEMGLYKTVDVPPGVGPFGQQINDEGKAFKTVSDLIYPTDYDAVETAKMGLTPNGAVRGYAFKRPNGQFVYALWARTQTDLSEAASATYSFPASMGLSSLVRHNWDWGYSQATTTVGTTGIQLNSTPVFFVGGSAAPVCAISGSITQVVCNNNGTPAISTDDTWTFSLNMSNSGPCGTGYTVAGGATGTGSYNVARSFGPFSISSGARTLTITDNANPTATFTITQAPPSTCSNGGACTLASSVSNIQCNNNGTPNITTDDTYTFSVTVTSTGTCGSTWIEAGGLSGNYGVARAFGPFPISGGNRVLTINDVTNTSATTTATAVAPTPCSTPTTCAIIGAAATTDCNNNGTPLNAADDTYTITIVANASGNCSTGYAISATGIADVATYGQPKVIGPFPISGGNKVLTLRDNANFASTATLTAVAPPTCSGTGNTCTNNLLSNPGFESGLTGWNTGTGITTATGGNGGSAGAVSHCTNGQRIWQTVAGVGGTAYTFQAFARTNGTQATGTLALKFMNSSFTPLLQQFSPIVALGTYSSFSVNGTAPAGTAFIEVSILKETGAGCLVIDDVCVGASGTNPNPSITFTLCPAQISVAAASGTNSAIVTYPTPTATATNCATAVSVVRTSPANTASGSSFPVGTTNVIWTATCGTATATCSFTVTVTPNNPNPTVAFATCPTNITVNAAAGATTAVATYATPTATAANCNTAPSVVRTSPANTASGSSFPIGTTNVVWTATCGTATATCSFTVTVIGSNPTTCTNNQLSNAGFESQFFALWSVDNSTTTTQIAGGANGSATAASICTNGTRIYQTKPAVPGRLYNLEAYAKQANGAASGTLVLKFLNSSWTPLFSDFGGINSTTTNFNLYTVSEVAPVGTAFVEVSVLKQSGAGCLIVDDICLTDGATPCAITATASAPVCNNNGTPNITTDDTFTFSVTVNSTGACGTGWNGPGGVTGTYGVARQFGPIPISQGDQNIVIFDNGSPIATAAMATVSVVAPAACSNGGCTISTVAQNKVCNNAGTNTNPADDTWTFDLVVTGTGTCGTTWSATNAFTTGSFSLNTPRTSVGLPISAGPVTFTVISGSATQSVTVTPPATCSTGNACTVSATATSIICSNNGTPTNPADDTYTFTLNPTSAGACGPNFTIAGEAGGAYGFSSVRGPYPISAGNKSLTLVDFQNPTSTFTLTVPAPPTCSGGGNGAIDLSLTAAASPQNPGIWANTVITLTITNAGPQQATGVIVQTPAQSTAAFSNVLAYSSHTASGGTYDAWLGTWNVGTLAAGQSRTLTYNAFTKTATSIPFFAQVNAAGQTDGDSQPNNNTTGVPAQDDEARVNINSPLALQSGDKSQLSEQELADAFVLYPNPAGETTYLSVEPYLKKQVQISVVNQLGKVVDTEQIDELKTNILEIDLSNYENGIYFVQITTSGHRTITKKLIVARMY